MIGLAPRAPTNDEALEILRRLEPMLRDLQAEQREIKSEQKDQRRELGRLQQDVSEMKGRMSLLHTIWQVVGAVNAAVLALGFALANILIRLR